MAKFNKIVGAGRAMRRVKTGFAVAGVAVLTVASLVAGLPPRAQAANAASDYEYAGQLVTDESQTWNGHGDSSLRIDAAGNVYRMGGGWHLLLGYSAGRM